MRFPKTIKISGKTYTVKKNDERWGGRIRTGNQEIIIGTEKDQSAERIFNNFVHEIIEGVTLERHLRYEAADDELMFVMTHKQFDNFAKDVATAIRPLIKR